MTHARSNECAGHHTEQSGYVLEVVLRVVLMLLVVGQIVFLAGRYRQRVDMTADGLYTLTDSTVQVLGNLDRRLVIEAYFSEEDTLGPYREYRRTLNNFLDELVQVSGGRVAVDRLNPQDDVDIRHQAERLGIEARQLQDVGDASLSVNQVWNGLRLLYGGDRQDVVPFLGLTAYPMGYELQLTPRIKALTVEQKPVLGLIAYGTQAVIGGPYGDGGGIPSMGYRQLHYLVQDRYELRDVDLTRGQLVPEEIDTVFLVRPKNLTNREKYAIDQFLMRGGSLVVFVDTDEVEIGEQRLFRRRQVSYDAPGNEEPAFLDQLLHYGVHVQEKVIADFTGILGGRFPQAAPTANFRLARLTHLGPAIEPLDLYPYWFHAADVNYPEFAAEIAAMETAPGVDVKQLTARYAELFEPGVDTANILFKTLKGRGPSMFWPCPVDLAEKLPDGVDGKVLLRTSPLAYAETPPDSFNPFGRSQEMQKAAYTAFRNRKLQQLQSEPRQQFGLMVDLNGSFSSFFEGRAIPPRFAGEDESLPVPDPLAEPIVESPVENGGEESAEESEDPPEVARSSVGQDKEADPDPIWRAPPGARLIVIGDADFIRDDLRAAQGSYGPESTRYGPLGPMSLLGPRFFATLVDWLAGDDDLLALHSVNPTSRTLNFATEDMESGSDEFLGAIRARERTLRLLVVGGPVVAIVLVWVVAALRRRARKQAFLTSVGN